MLGVAHRLHPQQASHERKLAFSNRRLPRTRPAVVYLAHQQEHISFDEYQRRPNRLVSDFNGEKTFVTDYIGREILELLQNANDAAAKAGKRGNVHFELLPAGLIAANTGAAQVVSQGFHVS